MSNEGKIRVPVTDKNGKQTHVWKTPEEIKNAGTGSRTTKIPSTSTTTGGASNVDSTPDSFGANPSIRGDESAIVGKWKQTIDLSALSYPDLTLGDRAELIYSKISESQWMKDNVEAGESELSDNLEEIQEAGETRDPGRFDIAWNNIYNLADIDSVRLDTA